MFNFMWPLLLPLVPFTLLDQSTARVITQGNSKEQAPLVTSSQDPGTLATRSYFYVGGEYVCVWMSLPRSLGPKSWKCLTGHAEQPGPTHLRGPDVRRETCTIRWEAAEVPCRFDTRESSNRHCEPVKSEYKLFKPQLVIGRRVTDSI